jgi:hypothetical protein
MWSPGCASRIETYKADSLVLFRRYGLPMVAALCSVVALASILSGQDANSSKAASGWVPFIARYTQTSTANAFGGPYRIRTSGIFVRDSHGSWYRRQAMNPHDSPLPVVGQTNFAMLHDAIQQKDYVLDYQRKTVKRLDTKTSGSSDNQPPSIGEFEKLRADDTLVGKETVSGLECVIYGIHDPKHKGKFVAQNWYAPSLNFLLIKTQARVNGEDVGFLIDQIQAGKEPERQYFELPQDFKIIQ